MEYHIHDLTNAEPPVSFQGDFSQMPRLSTSKVHEKGGNGHQKRTARLICGTCLQKTKENQKEKENAA